MDSPIEIYKRKMREAGIVDSFVLWDNPSAPYCRMFKKPKRIFLHKQAADGKAMSLRAKKMGDIKESFKCRYCKGWHLTTIRK